MSSVKVALQAGVDKTVDSVTYTDALVAPLITHTTRLYYDSGAHGTTDYEYPNATGGNLYYQSGTHHHHGVYWGELKYAIRVHLIIKAIEEQYGITFSTDFFNTTNDPYYNLYLWMHRKKGNIDDPNAPETYDHLVDFGVPDTSGWNNLTISGEDIIVTGMTGVNKLVSTFTVFAPNETSNYTVSLIKAGTVVESFSGTAPNSVAVSADLTNGTYNLKITVSEEFTCGNASTNAVEFDASDLTQPISGQFTVSTFTIDATKTFSGTGQMPKMRVIDFLTGLFKVFNLTAYKQDDGTIKVETLDDFYASGTTYTIDEYIDMSQRTVDVALPYKEINFKFKGIGTKLAIQHAQLTQGFDWGSIEYKGGDSAIDEIAGGIYNVEAPFEHMKFERMLDAGNNYSNTDAQVGWFVDDNDDPYLGEALLFYPIQITNGTVISFLEQETASSGSHVQIDDYIIPSNSVSLNASTDDDVLHFNQELNEYTPSGDFDGTLFENYYKNYITDVFVPKRRIIKFKAFLPLKILRKYTLADKFIINNQEYRINSITTNLGTGESDLELLNVV